MTIIGIFMTRVLESVPDECPNHLGIHRDGVLDRLRGTRKSIQELGSALNCY